MIKVSCYLQMPINGYKEMVKLHRLVMTHLTSLHLGGLLHVDGVRQSLAEIGRNLGKVRDGALSNEALSVNQMTGDVRHQSLSGGIVQNGIPEDCRLAEVVFVSAVESVNFARDFVRLLQCASTLSWFWT